MRLLSLMWRGHTLQRWPWLQLQGGAPVRIAVQRIALFQDAFGLYNGLIQQIIVNDIVSTWLMIIVILLNTSYLIWIPQIIVTHVFLYQHKPTNKTREAQFCIAFPSAVVLDKRTPSTGATVGAVKHLRSPHQIQPQTAELNNWLRRFRCVTIQIIKKHALILHIILYIYMDI